MVVSKSLLLALHRIPFLRTAEKVLLADLMTDEQDLCLYSKQDLEVLTGRRLNGVDWRPEVFLDQGEQDLQALVPLKPVKVVPYWSRSYPPLLREIHDPPFLLFIRGKIPAVDRPSIAVVGTRHPDNEGLQCGYRFGVEIALAGLWSVSGLALGIDGAVHRGAVSIRGATAAVLAGGIDLITPKSHRELAGKLLESGGCLISEQPPGRIPARYSFPRRNRLISGICRGTVLVQAPVRSGALITADFCLDQGRDLFVCGGFEDRRQGGGNRKLIDSGAPVFGGLSPILEDWQFSSKNLMPMRFFHTERPGERLAFLLEEELEDRYQLYAGSYYGAVRHG